MTKPEAIADGKKMLEECGAAGSDFVHVLKKRLVNVLEVLTAEPSKSARTTTKPGEKGDAAN